jgi:hypothetical protein
MSSKGKSPKLPFGELAVRKGYCTPKQVEEALRLQRQVEAKGRPRPLTGIIMVQNGFISTGQLIDILRAYQDEPEGEET